MELYISGIHWGHFDLGENKIQILDPFTGEFQDYVDIDEAVDAKLFGLTRMRFSVLIRRLREASLTTDSFVLSDGAVYEKKDEHNLIQRHVKFPMDLIVSNRKVVGVQTANRDFAAVLIEPGYEKLTFLPEWNQLYTQTYNVSNVVTHMVSMRDGVRLATDIWLPKDCDKSKLPCVLIRTPYGKASSATGYYKYVMRGFAVVIQDTRGREDSEGEWIPIHNETEDGDDTLNWIAAQNWSDGSVGMIGGSYLGYVQWAAAASGNPHLKALVSEVTAGSAFTDIPKRGGTLGSGMLAWAFAVSKREMDASLMLRDDWDEVLSYRPLDDVCKKALGYDVPFWNEWMKHECDDEFWKKGDWEYLAKQRGGVTVPALIQSGWFDDNGMGTTQALDLTKDYPKENRKFILGPWMHSGNANYDLHGVEMGNNAIRYDIDLQFFKWFEKHLRGRKIDMGAPVEYFTIGENKWKNAIKWPVEKTEEMTLFLTSSGNANSSNGDGELSFKPVGKMCSDSYEFDPKDPGTHIIDVSENELEVPQDYTKEELRNDYLCYTSNYMEEDVVITGDLNVSLYLSSDAPDTDIFVRLTRVDKDGKSIKLADGMLDVKFREGFDKMVWMEKGQVYPVNIRTTKISAKFSKGERIRLTVTSGAKNFIFPNSNTKDGYHGSESVVANNTLHHGGVFPSKICCLREII